MKELLMGNEAIAVGALAAGVQVVAGYPGTPSTEVLETIAARNPGGVHVEWSVNEKAGAEVAAGAAYAGARTMVTMKQMGLNVASDPVMCVNYIGVKGGMVIYVADDPGPISSQTEQDTRTFGAYAKIPVFDCDAPEQAFQAVQDAFEFSEKYETPVILRATTRVCHGCAVVDVPELKPPKEAAGFVKDSKWVIFPKLSYNNKHKLVKREEMFSEYFSSYSGNTVEGSGRIGIACGGVSHSYVMDAIEGHEEAFQVLKIATPYPFPHQLAEQFMESVDQVLVFEELDPYIEDRLIYHFGGKNSSAPEIIGKRTGTVPAVGELSAEVLAEIIQEKTGVMTAIRQRESVNKPELPIRPPVLCAGCPHRGAFYAVKQATKGKKAIYHGDIGCYTLGNAAPLDMVDTCLCMGAGITMAQGVSHAEPDTLNFAFVGDSTFFASGITGTVNAVYNQAEMILVVLDNSTTAMTGHQPHPGMGITMMGKRTEPVDIAKVLEGIGVTSVRTVDPLDYQASVDAVSAAVEESGVRALIFKSPCIAITKPTAVVTVDETACVGCMQCINQLGCPAIVVRNEKAFIDKSLCTGCGLCTQICPKQCMKTGGR